MELARLSIALAVIMTATLFTRADSARAQGQECSAGILDATEITDVERVWQQLERPTITRIQSSSPELRSYRIMGDRIALTPENFPDLARDPTNRLTKLEALIIDAREIVVDMPLHFASGRIELRGDIVRFTPRGLVAFYDPPRARNEGLFVLARAVDASAFGVQRYTPFQFTTTHPTWPAGFVRRVVIQAGSVDGPLAPLDPAAAREYLYFRSLDSESPLISFEDKDLQRRYEVDISASSEATYEAAIRSGRVLWPMHTALKTRDFQTRYPYSVVGRSHVASLKNRHARSLAASANEKVNLILGEVEGRYVGRRDGLGYTEYYVPRESFQSLLRTAKERSSQNVALARAWLSLHLEVKGRRQFDPKNLEKQQAGIREGHHLIAQVSASVSSNIGQIASLAQEISAADSEIGEAMSRLQAQIEDDLRKQDDARNIQAAGTVLSMGAAFLPGGPAVQVGVATLTTAVSRSVGGHQVGQTRRIANFGDLAQTITADAQTAQDSISQANSLRCSWRKVGFVADHVRDASNSPSQLSPNDICSQPVARPEGSGLRELAGALKEFHDQGQKVRATLFAQSSAGIAGTNLEMLASADASYQRLIARRADYAVRLGRLEDARQRDEAHLVQLTADVIRMEAELQTALGVDLNDFVGRADLLSTSLAATEVNLASVIQRAALLSRALSYHSGRLAGGTSVSSAELASERDTILSRVRSSESAALASTDQIEDVVTLKQSIEQDVARFELKLADFVDQVTSLYDDYISRSGNLEQVEFRMAYSVPERLTDQTVLSANFVNAVNRAIRNQIAFKVDPELIAIPDQVWDSAFGRRERILARGVSFRFRDPQAMRGRSIEIRVLHPRFGRVRSLESCRFVDFRTEADTELYEVFTSTCGPDGTCRASQAPTSSTDLQDENRRRTLLPVNTIYLAQIIVHGGGLSEEVPEVIEIDLTTTVIR